MSNGLLAGKRGLVMGVANDKSIAWACAQACAAEGASLKFNYVGDALEKTCGQAPRCSYARRHDVFV